MGCFWGAERLFWQLGRGIYTTAVGYQGGETPNPTYEETCTGRTGHAEVVLVAFDPKVVSYAALLKLFWESHDPTQGMRQGNDVGTTYRSTIYTTTPEQLREAEASKAVYEKGAERLGPGADHHRDPAGPDLLLRRGVPPAISAAQSARLLRLGRHGRLLPDRPRGRGGISRGGVAAHAETGGSLGDQDLAAGLRHLGHADGRFRLRVGVRAAGGALRP